MRAFHSGVGEFLYFLYSTASNQKPLNSFKRAQRSNLPKEKIVLDDNKNTNLCYFQYRIRSIAGYIIQCDNAINANRTIWK